MGEIKHTPGPWRWQPSPHRTHPDMGAFFGADGRRVCWFGDAEQYYPTQGEPPSEADAHLIAAAPEMKEALESTLWTLSVVDGSALCGGARDLLAMLVSEVESALAKANGEAPQ